MRRSLLLSGLVAAFLLVCPTGAMARDTLPELPAQVKALLDGHRIPLNEVVNHHCHDLEAQTYRCFDTEAERDADALAFLGEHETGGTSAYLESLIAPLSSLNFTFALAYTA